MNVPEQLFYLLFQIVRQRDARFDAQLAPVGLTLARWRTLAIIRRLDACSMKELALYTTVDRTTLTRSVDQLVEGGLVDRQVSPTDRRVVLLTLSEAGDATYDKAVQLLLDFNRELIDGVPPEVLRSLTRTMETVLYRLFTDPKEAEAVARFGRISDPQTEPG